MTQDFFLFLFIYNFYLFQCHLWFPSVTFCPVSTCQPVSHSQPVTPFHLERLQDDSWWLPSSCLEPNKRSLTLRVALLVSFILEKDLKNFLYECFTNFFNSSIGRCYTDSYNALSCIEHIIWFIGKQFNLIFKTSSYVHSAWYSFLKLLIFIQF